MASTTSFSNILHRVLRESPIENGPGIPPPSVGRCGDAETFVAHDVGRLTLETMFRWELSCDNCEEYSGLLPGFRSIVMCPESNQQNSVVFLMGHNLSSL